jgi:hypothetical protein
MDSFVLMLLKAQSQRSIRLTTTYSSKIVVVLAHADEVVGGFVGLHVYFKFNSASFTMILTYTDLGGRGFAYIFEEVTNSKWLSMSKNSLEKSPGEELAIICCSQWGFDYFDYAECEKDRMGKCSGNATCGMISASCLRVDIALRC